MRGELMTEFSRGSFGETIVMQCQVCMNPHHDGPKEVLVQDQRTSAYAKKLCPLCMCLDCVQKFDDPIRTQVRPLMMGQTLRSQYNLTIEEFDKRKGHTAPVSRQLQINGPGPLNLQDLLKQMGDVMGVGLQQPQPQRQHKLGIACPCGKNAVSKCINCEKPLCMKCLKIHECDEG
jgi:hypothetical protein